MLGAVDGLITLLVYRIASGAAAALEKRAVLVISTSSVFADAFSMGVSEYLQLAREPGSPTRLLRGRPLLPQLPGGRSGSSGLVRAGARDVGVSGALFAAALLGVGLSGRRLEREPRMVGVRGGCARFFESVWWRGWWNETRPVAKRAAASAQGPNRRSLQLESASSWSLFPMLYRTAVAY